MTDEEFARMYECRHVYPEMIRDILEYTQEKRNEKAGLEGRLDSVLEKNAKLSAALVPFTQFANALTTIEQQSLADGATAHYVIAMEEDEIFKTLEAGAFRDAVEALETAGYDPLSAFSPGTQIQISVIFPGEYRVGYTDRNHRFVPGSGSYYRFSEAVAKAAAAFERNRAIFP